jgi:DNA-binding NarL/FixJ family response regulator
MTAAPITVLLADDHLVVREGVRWLVNANADMRVIGEVGTGALAVTAAKSLRPDVVVMDIAMPVLGGLDAARQILAASPKAKILLLSAYLDDDYIDHAMKIGVMGYLVKQTSSSLLGEAIRTVHAGKKIFSPVVEARVRSSHENFPGRAGKASRKIASLTRREAEVLRLIATGKSNQEAAACLAISTKTIEKHRQNVMNKLNIHDIAGLTRYAISDGLLGNLDK